MHEQSTFVPVKRVLTIINSCETKIQLQSALRLIDNYVAITKYKGVINSELVRKRLMKDWKQKLFQIKMVRSFIRREEKEFRIVKSKNKLKTIAI